jgi:hypothetical protein
MMHDESKTPLSELRRDLIAAAIMLAAVVAGTALVHLFL